MQKGRLVIAGTGMTLGAHLTPVAASYLRQADVVFAAVTDGLTEQWLAQLNPKLRSFAPLYAAGTSRHQTYQQMVALMLEEVRAGKLVVGAFYGHPGVFAYAPHQAIRQAHEEGFEALMLAGISAADCLYADLGIDPGRVGCQYYEASQLMFYQRRLDPSAYLVLWQIALAGDRSIARFDTGRQELQLLLELLLTSYPPDHQVILYEAASMPFQQPRIDWLALADLPVARLTLQSTLVLPPAQALVPNQPMLAKLAALAERS